MFDKVHIFPLLRVCGRICGLGFVSRSPQITLCVSLCRLYWYRGVMVLLPGWLIWKFLELSTKSLLLGQLASVLSALSTPNGGEGYNSSTDFNPNRHTISSIQLQCIQATRPHLADKTKSIKKYTVNLLPINLHTVPTYLIIFCISHYL